MNFLDELAVVIAPKGVEESAVLLCMVASLVLGFIISFVYKLTNKGHSYESSFQFTIVMVTVIISVIMLTIGSNIALSLGLIGSLSIIRFRAVIKNTSDMAFLFWAIATGLALGSQNYHVAALSAGFLSVVIVALSKFNIFEHTNSDFILIIRLSGESGFDSESSATFSEIFNRENCRYEMKSSFIDKKAQSKEITYSIYPGKSSDCERLLSEMNKVDFLESASLLSPNTNLHI